MSFAEDPFPLPPQRRALPDYLRLYLETLVVNGAPSITLSQNDFEALIRSCPVRALENPLPLPETDLAVSVLTYMGVPVRWDRLQRDVVKP